MASGTLTFRTPHIEEVPIANSKQAPGFAWVAVAKDDPARAQLEIGGKKRARNANNTLSEDARDVLTKRREREVDALIARLNSEGTKDVSIPALKRDSGVKNGKTTNTKKILSSGKDLKHYVEDEEAEMLRTGRADIGNADDTASQRSSKMPIARRLLQEDSIMTDAEHASLPYYSEIIEEDSTLADFDALPPFPTADIVQALLDAPPLTYKASTKTPSYAPTAPPRRFCEICGFFGRSRCLKCSQWTCSVECQDNHLADRCQKFYA